MIKRFLAPMAVLGLGLLLASCGSYSGYVADHWPRWAGGLPDDVPPRPGAPGYDEFIAHKPADKPADKDATAPAPVVEKVNTQMVPSANPPPSAKLPPSVKLPPSANLPATDRNVVQGGLY